MQELVALQEQLAQQTVTQGAQQRTQALMVALGGFAAVVVLALVLGRWVVLQLTTPLARAKMNWACCCVPCKP